MQTLSAIRPKYWLAALLLCAGASAQAQVHEFMNCTLNPGKTPSDATNAFNAFGTWIEANTKRPKPVVAEMLWEFYNDEEQGGTGFVLHLVWDDFKKLGNVLNMRWDKGGFQKEPEGNTYTCAGSRIFWTNPQQQ